LKPSRPCTANFPLQISTIDFSLRCYALKRRTASGDQSGRLPCAVHMPFTCRSHCLPSPKIAKTAYRCSVSYCIYVFWRVRLTHASAKTKDLTRLAIRLRSVKGQRCHFRGSAGHFIGDHITVHVRGSGYSRGGGVRPAADAARFVIETRMLPCPPYHPPFWAFRPSRSWASPGLSRHRC
jgi:hypothetical protein